MEAEMIIHAWFFFFLAVVKAVELPQKLIFFYHKDHSVKTQCLAKSHLTFDSVAFTARNKYHVKRLLKSWQTEASLGFFFFRRFKLSVVLK